MARVSSTPTKRPRKTDQQKAIEALDAAIKTRDTAEVKLAKLKQGLEPAQEAFDHAEARVKFLQQNPDLPADRRVDTEAAAEESQDEEAPTLEALPES